MSELHLVSMNIDFPQAGGYLFYMGGYGSCALGLVKVGVSHDIMLDTKTRGLMNLSALSMDDLGHSILYPLDEYMVKLTEAKPIVNIPITRSMAETIEEVMKRRDNTQGIERMAAEGLAQVLADPQNHGDIVAALQKSP